MSSRACDGQHRELDEAYANQCLEKGLKPFLTDRKDVAW